MKTKQTSLIEKVQPGQRLRSVLNADLVNAFKDAAYRANRVDAVGPGIEIPTDSDIIKVKNTSGETIDRFGIIGIDEVIYTPTDNLQEFKNAFALKGGKPDTDGYSFAILLETLEDGKIGAALASGVGVTQLYVPPRPTPSPAPSPAPSPGPDDDDYGYADSLEDNITNLGATDSGPAEILWREAGVSDNDTDLKWAVVRLSNRPPALASWQAYMSTYQDFISGSAEMTPAVINFDTEDTDCIKGHFWSFNEVTHVLTITKDRRLRYHLDVPLKMGDSDGGLQGTCSLWMQISTDDGDTWAAVPRSGQNVTQMFPTEVLLNMDGSFAGACPAEASEGRPTFLSVSRILEVEEGEQFRIVFQQVNGPVFKWRVLDKDVYPTIGSPEDLRLGANWGFDDLGEP